MSCSDRKCLKCDKKVFCRNFCHTHYRLWRQETGPKCEYCDKTVVAKKLCEMHYHRLMRNWDPLVKTQRLIRTECIACGRKHKARELCNTCYRAWQISGKKIEDFIPVRIEIMKHLWRKNQGAPVQVSRAYSEEYSVRPGLY